MNAVSRLAQTFIPNHYDLSITLERAERTFHGTVVIEGTSREDATDIVVHAKDLAISSVTIDGKEGQWTIGENDELHLTHDDIAIGPHIVTVAFSGAITDAMHGLYPCYYEHNGIKKELLATQFESHHAREVFPCIDEPGAKATFALTLTTEPEVTVLGNMPVEQQRTENGSLVTFFQKSPRMSTYLLAWVVGELHRKTATTKSGVEVNVWATPVQRPESLDFALDIATRTIDFFDDYFGVPYPLPKSDHVALPDFSSGAMENWGLITYREIALLADPKTISVSSKHYIATVVAHELSHQWFGNLVTMKWWNDLWLNESFATLMEYIAVDALHPEWEVWLDFASSESIMALRRDSLDGVQAVQVDVAHPDEISTLFDGAIVYAKGARLLRMCETYVGKEAFQVGLRAYFQQYAYSNTEAANLWDALSKASGKNISEFMSTWISQSGYPVVAINQQPDAVTLSQQQFFVGPHEPSNKLWPIPLGATEAFIPERLDVASITVPQSSDHVVRLNRDDAAHFLTHYDEKSLQSLGADVANHTLSAVDRLQLLDEQTLLARGGVSSSASLIPLLEQYRHETNEAVWSIISIAIAELKKFVEDDETSEAHLRTFAGTIGRAQYELLGWDARAGEPESATKLRSTIVATMLYARDSDAIKQALERYTSTSLSDLDPELRSLIIGTAVRESTDATIIDSLLADYRQASSSELRQDIAAGLTSNRDPKVLRQLLELLKDPATIRAQDASHWYVWLIRNKYGRELAWQWLRDNWSWVQKTFGGDKSYDDFPRYTASALRTHIELKQYRDFFTPMQGDPALSRVITIGIGEIQGRVELLERDGDAVRERLAEL